MNQKQRLENQNQNKNQNSNQNQNTKITLKQNQEQVLNRTVFKDPRNPLIYADQDVKLLFNSCFQDGQTNYEKLNFDLLKFETKKTKNNFCTHYIKKEQEQYFICLECRCDQRAIYCQGCFNPQRHVGHKFYKTTTKQDYYYCCCGRIQKLKQSSFCKGHSNFDRIIQYEIPEQERKHFLNIMKNLLDYAIYQYYYYKGEYRQQLLLKILTFLSKLNESSIYYNRLTMELILQKSQFWLKLMNVSKPFNNHYIFFMGRYSRFAHEMHVFVNYLCGDLETRTNFILFLCKFMDSEDVICYFYKLDSREIFNHTVVRHLSDLGISNQYIQLRLKENLPSPTLQAKQIYNKHLENRLKLTDNSEKIIQLLKTNLTDLPKSTNKALFFKLLQLYPNFEQIQSMFGNKLKEREALKKINNAIFKTISQSDITAEIEILKNFRKYLFDNGVSQQKLQLFIKQVTPQLCNAIHSIDQKSSFPYYIVYLLTMINGSPNQEKVISEIWDILLTYNHQVCDKCKKLSFTELHFIADTFQFIVNNVLKFDSFSVANKRMSLWPLKDSIIDQKMDAWFKSCLYQKRVITIQQLIVLQKNHLTTDNSNKILNQLCVYVQQQSSFVYASKAKYPNISHQFSVIPRKCKFKNIYECEIRFGDKLTLQEGSLSSILIPMIMKHKTFVESFDKQWKRYLSSQFAHNDNPYKFGYLYLFSLVLCDIVTDGNNKELRQRLQTIAKDRNNLLQFSKDKQELQLLLRLFNFHKRTEQQGKQQKYDEILKCIKNKKQQILQNARPLVQAKQNSKVQNNRCVCCRKQETLQQPFGYIGTVNTNNTICSLLYGNRNISKCLLSTCFHTIHIDCFMTLKSQLQNKRFVCPACNKFSNCLVPSLSHIQNQQYMRKCQKTMIPTANQNTKNQDTVNQEELFGLRQFGPKNTILRTFPQLQDKNKFYLKQLMLSLYRKSNNEQQNKYIKSIQQFATKIQKVQSKLHRLVQQLFTYSLKQLIVNQKKQINVIKQILLYLRNQIISSQYNTIQLSLRNLIELFGLDKQLLITNLIEFHNNTILNNSSQTLSLSKSIMVLPQAKIFMSTYNYRVCFCEGLKQSTGSCMLCSRFICQTCLISHANTEHNKVSFFASFVTGKLNIKTQNKSKQWAIYEDEFGQQLKEEMKNTQNFDIDKYNLNPEKYEQAFDFLLQI